MSKRQNSLKTFSNAVALGTLILLLGAIFLTLSSSLQQQQTRSSASTQTADVSPSFTIGGGSATQTLSLAPSQPQFITPTLYCVGGVGSPPCAPFITPTVTASPQPSNVTVSTTISPSVNPCESETASTTDDHRRQRRNPNNGLIRNFFDFIFRLISMLLNRQTTPTPSTPAPSVHPCPSTTPSVTVTTPSLPAASATLPIGVSPSLSASTSPVVSQTASASPSVNPCDTSGVATAQDDHRKRHPKRGRGKNRGSNGLISQMFALLLKIIEQLIARLGSPTPTPTPSPSGTPSQSPSTGPSTQPNPCPSSVPSTTVSITSAVTGIVLVSPTVTQPVTGNTGTTKSVQITFYGAYDNDPPGSLNISNPVLHQQAGGTGTFNDPLTFASPTGTGEYPIGTKIYVPSVQKYFMREDTCATSATAPNGCGAVTHVDLYMGNPSGTQAVLACENKLTPSGNGTIILNPPATLPYDPTPLWNQSTGACMTLH